MSKTEQTNGGSILKIGEFTTDESKVIKMPPEKAKKITIATVSKINEILEEKGLLDIEVETHDVYKDGDKIVKRVDAKTGKVLTTSEKVKSGRKKKEEITK